MKKKTRTPKILPEENLAKRQLRREGLVFVKMLLPLLAVILVGAHFHHFVVNAILANIEINGLILVTIMYGTLLILSRLLAALSDFRVIQRFGLEAKSGAPMQSILEEPWISDRYIRHYLKHVAAIGSNASREANQHAIESELHALNDEYNSKLELPQFLVGFMIALGLLGTFIGLLETLTGISGMLDGMGGGGEATDQQFMKLVSELRKPLAGMGIAFSASMFGLVGSLVLSVMMINLRRYIARVILLARNVMHDITEVKHTSDALDPRMAAGPGGSGGGAHGDNLYDNIVFSPDGTATRISDSGTVLLAGRLDVFMGRMDALLRVLEASLANGNILNDLLGFGPRMKDTAERTLFEIKGLAEQGQEQQRLMRQSYEAQNHTISTLNALMEQQRAAHHDLSKKAATLIDKLSALDEATVASGRHLWEMREIFAKIATTITAQDMMASAIGQQSVLTEAVLGEIRTVRQWVVRGVNAATAPQQTRSDHEE